MSRGGEEDPTHESFRSTFSNRSPSTMRCYITRGLNDRLETSDGRFLAIHCITDAFTCERIFCQMRDVTSAEVYVNRCNEQVEIECLSSDWTFPRSRSLSHEHVLTLLQKIAHENRSKGKRDFNLKIKERKLISWAHEKPSSAACNFQPQIYIFSFLSAKPSSSDYHHHRQPHAVYEMIISTKFSPPADDDSQLPNNENIFEREENCWEFSFLLNQAQERVITHHTRTSSLCLYLVPIFFIKEFSFPDGIFPARFHVARWWPTMSSGSVIIAIRNYSCKQQIFLFSFFGFRELINKRKMLLRDCGGAYTVCAWWTSAFSKSGMIMRTSKRISFSFNEASRGSNDRQFQADPGQDDRKTQLMQVERLLHESH